MRKYKVTFLEFGRANEDGSRDTVRREVLASCKDRGTAEQIAQFFRDGSFSILINENRDSNGRGIVPDRSLYALAVEQ